MCDVLFCNHDNRIRLDSEADRAGQSEGCVYSAITAGMHAGSVGGDGLLEGCVWSAMSERVFSQLCDL